MSVFTGQVSVPELITKVGHVLSMINDPALKLANITLPATSVAQLTVSVAVQLVSPLTSIVHSQMFKSGLYPCV